jgi:hypothetical protein
MFGPISLTGWVLPRYLIKPFQKVWIMIFGKVLLPKGPTIPIGFMAIGDIFGITEEV